MGRLGNSGLSSSCGTSLAGRGGKEGLAGHSGRSMPPGPSVVPGWDEKAHFEGGG